ncbi:hypothetical protein [Schlesneria paludicola]|uniref:hypothetical protein n=1 Tax=Schlesneria paludicola TaxID=360056 RepID=UPI0012FB2946|nr:hypothetical protein [Schlesneria paludicola]
MSPAFSSIRQMVAFVLLLMTFIGLPAFMGRTGLLDRRDVYPTIAWKYGFFPWIQQQVFTETADVDIAFVGTSHLWWAVDTPYVKETLSKQLGHDVNAITLGWPWQGFDGVYTMAKDLLDHRHVKMLVITDEGIANVPHNHSCRWFRIGENSDSLKGLSWLGQAQLYSGAILGMPRHLLSLVRPNIVEFSEQTPPNWWNARANQTDLNISGNLGSIKMRKSIDTSHDFTHFRPMGQATSEDVISYSDRTASQFAFAGPPPEFQLHFARKLAELCRERGTRLVLLNIPLLSDREKTVVPERCHWPDVLGTPVDMVGIPPAKLFSGVESTDLNNLFYDNDHLNQNGQEWFTQLITPMLGKLYVTSASRQ